MRSEATGEVYCRFKGNLPHLGRSLVTRQTLRSCLAVLPGTRPAPLPPPAACLCLRFPARTPRWPVAATTPARPPGSCRHGGLLQAEAYLSPRWPQKLPVCEGKSRGAASVGGVVPQNEAKDNPAVRGQEPKAFTPGLEKTWNPVACPFIPQLQETK